MPQLGGMSVLAALFVEAPGAAWLGLASLCLGAALATGRARFTVAALTCFPPALLGAVGVPGGFQLQACLFAAACLAFLLVVERGRGARRAAVLRRPPAHGLPTPKAGMVQGGRRSFGLGGPPAKRAKAPAGLAKPSRGAAPQGRAARAPAVIGARGRALGEFCNGVGRVWIDRAEWAAELIQGEALGSDRDVEVVGVSGGVRLRVRALA